eukprot:CAMPEP_0206606992 /NCGR_PEP_ID=MMETSP0325_2-20121206/51802_1 /ASSEMBLY_ACC=CAM_ASM_000347 /TAXON_ID=2866 /ORGANISM="Crypthecodinium cohnii, Strain Seligo" /LENGTH=64 /DNA_ID=CAMNT_0054123755 /DNA_START=832 /DNA_END=1026 /DNA_ORIENTATION=+
MNLCCNRRELRLHENRGLMQLFVKCLPSGLPAGSPMRVLLEYRLHARLLAVPEAYSEQLRRGLR